ncbi:uncharacterized protein [Eurosta solidaginis]|uniref:uncharacterized protein isoform X2 n=1 Tax=Eurosta solidaginis TaxID=178769 RepID=UPI0035306360
MEAPTTGSSSAYSYTSAISPTSSGAFQLPFIDVNAKVGLLTSLFTAFKGFKGISIGSPSTTTTTTTSSPIEVNTIFTPSETTTKKHKHSKHSKTSATSATTTENASENSDIENTNLTADSTSQVDDFVSNIDSDAQTSADEMDQKHDSTSTVDAEKPTAGDEADTPIRGEAELSESIIQQVNIRAGESDSGNEILDEATKYAYLPPYHYV